MTNIEMILKQIEADKYNLQVMIDLMPLCTTKGERRSLDATVKKLVKEIHNQKVLIDEKLFGFPPRVAIPLFEVEPSVQEAIDIYRDMDSYLGNLDILD